MPTDDPLKDALTAIAEELDSDMRPLVDALIAGHPPEDQWNALVQELLDEA